MIAKGMNLDYHPYEIPLGDYLYGRNILTSERAGAVTNEVGNVQNLETFMESGIVIGHIQLYEQREVLFVVKEAEDEENNESWIVVCDFNKRTVQIPANWDSPHSLHTFLKFNKNHPITGVFHVNDLNETIIAWTDNLNPLRILNLGDIESPVTNIQSLNDLPLFKDKIASVIDYEITIGNLKGGAYVLGYVYVDEEDNTYSLMNMTPAIYIDDLELVNDDGNPSDIITGKGINMTIVRDATFKYWRPVVFLTVNNVTRVFIGPKVIDDKTSITSLTQYFETTMEEIISVDATFKRCKALGVEGNRLYAGNIEEFTDDEYELRQLTNEIQLRYVCVPREATKGAVTFQHGEVYAFYVRFHRNDGSYTRAFLLVPDRTKPLGSVAVPELGASTRIEPVWKVEDTCIKLSPTTGTMGYWENENEVYPEGYPIGVTGEVIRHYKMPTMKFIMDNHATDPVWEANYGVGTYPFVLDALMVRAIIPSYAIPEGYQGLELLYAERTFENSLVVGTDALIYSWEDSTQPNRIIAATGNHSAQIKQNLVTDTFLNRKPEYVRLHCKDMIEKKPSMLNTYFRADFKIKRDASALTDSEFKGFFQVYDKGSLAHVAQNLMIWDMYNATEVGSSPTVISDRQFTVLGNPLYMASNVIVSSGLLTFNNIGSEQCVIAESAVPIVSSGGTAIGYFLDGSMSDDSNSRPDSPTGNEIYFGTINYFKNDCYLGYTQQNLVFSGYVKKDGGGILIGTGDSYNGLTHMNTSSFGRNVSDMKSAFKAQYRIFYEGRLQQHLRYEGPNAEDKYYPKTSTNFVGITNRPIMNEMEQWDTGKDVNTFYYDSSYSKLNDYRQTGVFGPSSDDEFSGMLPYRIRRSEPLTEIGNNWRKFKPLEYYDMPKHKGTIVNLQAFGDRFIIHTDKSLFLTRTKTTISSDINQIVLGSNDLFSIEPQEVSPENEATGTKSKNACLITPEGYYFVNDTYGKVYKLANELEDLSAGLFHFFEEHLPFRKTIVEQVEIEVYPQYDNECSKDYVVLPMNYKGVDLFPMYQIYMDGDEEHQVIKIENKGDVYHVHFDNKWVNADRPILMTGFKRTHEVYWPDNPYLEKGYTIGHDLKYRRILLTKNAKEAEDYFPQPIQGVFLGGLESIGFKDGDLVLTEDGYRIVSETGISSKGQARVIFCSSCS